MKTAISLPDQVFEAADRMAQRLGIKRSQLFQRAVVRYLKEQRLDRVTEILDQVYCREESRLDEVLRALQAASIEREEW